MKRNTGFRILALLMLVALMCSACGASGPAEVTQGTQDFASSTEEILGMETVATTVSTTTEAVIAVEVTDAFSDSVYDDYAMGGMCCYHIPQIVSPNDVAKDFNKKIYKELYARMEEEVYRGRDESDYYPYLSEIAYCWGQQGDVICLVVKTLYAELSYMEKFDFYYISAATGEELSEDAFLEACGYTRSSFEEHTKGIVQRYWDANRAEKESYLDKETVQRMVDACFFKENIEKSRPFLSLDGEMCALAVIVSPLGDNYDKLLDISGAEVDMACKISHE